VLQDHDDDGETAAGGRLLHLLQIVDAHDVVYSLQPAAICDVEQS